MCLISPSWTCEARAQPMRPRPGDSVVVDTLLTGTSRVNGCGVVRPHSASGLASGLPYQGPGRTARAPVKHAIDPLAPSAQPAETSSIVAQKEPYRQSMEMQRLVLLDRVPANAESWFVARVFRHAASLGVRGVVAFSDPMPRRVGERLVKRGHLGVVYMATGGIYTGVGTARTVRMLPDGTVLPARTLAKITGGERGGDAAIARLVDMGAPPKPDRMPGRKWLPEALAAIGVRKVPHPGNHRYAWSIGPRWSRRAYPVALPALPYPRHPNPAVAA